VRYVVSNPGPLPVAIDPIVVTNGWWLSEFWALRSPTYAGGESVLGTTCPSLAGEGLGYVLTPSCAVGEVYPGELGAASAEGLCEPGLDGGATLTPAITSVMGRAATLDAGGVEGGAAPRVGTTTKTLVPAASGGAPGRIALYLARPLANRSIPATWTGSEWTLTQRVWAKTVAPAGPLDCPEGWPGEWDAVWELFLRPQRLERADDWLAGMFTLTAYAADAAGTAIIGPATPIATVDFTRTIGH
jgi:hypothetical protein